MHICYMYMYMCLCIYIETHRVLKSVIWLCPSALADIKLLW